MPFYPYNIARTIDRAICPLYFVRCILSALIVRILLTATLLYGHC